MTFFLFPGQGSQSPGMGHDLFEASPVAREVFEEAAGILGPDFLPTLFEGSDASVMDTRFAQPALVVTEVAAARHLETIGVQPAGCAGHSVGEFAALVLAGSMAFADAVRLTRTRGELMSDGVPDGGMAAVLGLQPGEIESALPEGVEVANYNGPQQTIISGTAQGLELAAAALRAAGARRVMPLKVSGPFHSSLMKAAGQAFQHALEGIELHAPWVRFISSVSGSDEDDPERIRTLLWQQISAPVRWTEVMAAVGPEPAAECGPGNVLQGLAKRMDGAPHVSAAGTVAAAEAFEVEETEAEELKES